MKNRSVLLLVIVFTFLIVSNQGSASATNGTIDHAYRYAWGENVGWVDFANITVTDTGLSGSAFGENIGWLDLSTVTNTPEGVLSGYAWGENVGWVNFANVTIGTNGVFSGAAYGENIGWITFGTGNNKVITDWRPVSARPVLHSSGGRLWTPSPIVPAPIITNITPGTVCKLGENFSAATGLPCISFEAPPALTCSLTVTLRFGSRGGQVKCLQANLTHLAVDGIFGLKTKASVIEFQKLHKLVPDGIVGPFTRGVINNIIK